MTAHPDGFNALLWRRFVAIARPYWQGEERARAWGLLGALTLLLLGQTAFNVAFNEQSGELTSALAARDAERFWTAIRSFTVILVLAVPIWGCYYFVRDTLALHWRRWLTAQCAQAGFKLDTTSQGLTGTTEDGKPFRIDLRPDGQASAKGTITIG